MLFTIHVLHIEQIRNICEFMGKTRKICLLNYMSWETYVWELQFVGKLFNDQ